MKVLKMISFLVPSLFMIQSSYGALGQECADQIYSKYHANEHKEVTSKENLHR